MRERPALSFGRELSPKSMTIPSGDDDEDVSDDEDDDDDEDNDDSNDEANNTMERVPHEKEMSHTRCHYISFQIELALLLSCLYDCDDPLYLSLSILHVCPQ